MKAKDGSPISQEIQHTIHQIGAALTIGQRDQSTRDAHTGKALDDGASTGID